ncbi:Pectate lyase catalytic [Macrophomina phaseolina MS6]|uniref:Pectate lyase n=1 Tax=Macrophomina phaseolina (strain MS6) TaxID=1126212 RepID=K2RAB2_MACPH|nr:Pectate lyase catalytic [Macrophomina phaseolina MS6]
MQFKYAALAAALAAVGSTQSLPIPASRGVDPNKGQRIVKPGNPFDGGMKEFGRGVVCNDKADTGVRNAVFVIEDGGVLRNAIIGADAVEGIHCEGKCTIENVWFRDVCEDAITLKGNGPYTITGGGAQNAGDKVIQHNGKGELRISNYQVNNVGKLFRTCGNCSNNGGPRSIVATGIRAFGVTSDLIGINSNYGDKASITGSCGNTKTVCQEYVGIEKGANGGKDSEKRVPPVGACTGQGGLARLPSC